MSAPELKQSDTGIWYIHWSEGRRSKRVSTRASDLASAKTFLGQWLLMENTQQTAAIISCAELWKVYEEGHIHKKVIDKTRSVAAWKNLAPHFENLPPIAVTQQVIDDYVQKRTLGKLGRKSKTSTVWLELVKLRGSWNYAVKRKILTAIDLPDFDIPAPPAARGRVLSDDEIEALLESAAVLRGDDGRLTRAERFLWLALETAARKRAIETLRWDQIDFNTRVIHYSEGVIVTSKKRASVPISDALLPVLRRAFDERRGPTVLDNTSPIYAALERVTRHAGVSGLTPHVLRHTAATIMARNNVSLWKIAGILGNSVAMVEKVYAKHCPEHLAEAVNQISAARKRLRPVVTEEV